MENEISLPIFNFQFSTKKTMIFEVKNQDKIYKADDLKSFNQQTKAFQKAFNEAEKENAEDVVIAHFDNANAMLYTNSDRVLIYLKECEDEDN